MICVYFIAIGWLLIPLHDIASRSQRRTDDAGLSVSNCFIH